MLKIKSLQMNYRDDRTKKECYEQCEGTCFIILIVSDFKKKVRIMMIIVVNVGKIQTY